MIFPWERRAVPTEVEERWTPSYGRYTARDGSEFVGGGRDYSRGFVERQPLFRAPVGATSAGDVERILQELAYKKYLEEQAEAKRKGVYER